MIHLARYKVSIGRFGSHSDGPLLWECFRPGTLELQFGVSSARAEKQFSLPIGSLGRALAVRLEATLRWNNQTKTAHRVPCYPGIPLHTDGSLSSVWFNDVRAQLFTTKDGRSIYVCTSPSSRKSASSCGEFRHQAIERQLFRVRPTLQMLHRILQSLDQCPMGARYLQLALWCRRWVLWRVTANIVVPARRCISRSFWIVQKEAHVVLA